MVTSIWHIPKTNTNELDSIIHTLVTDNLNTKQLELLKLYENTFMKY